MDDLERKRREQAWVGKIQRGNGAAYEAMFRAYYAPLCRFAVDYVKSEELAHEVVQEVFLTIWECRASWHPHSLRAYLYQAVRNQALNHLRSARTRAHIRLDWTDHVEENAATGARKATDTLVREELATAIQRAIEALPERRRMTYLLHRRHHFTYAEIAEIMEVSPKTVANQLSAALKFLREKLAPFR